MQLVELQRVRDSLERAGYAVFGITYDSQADLNAFANKHGVDYPLLSDEGSRVIRELGILDEDLEAHHARFGVQTRADHQGVAYPMTFLLDAEGRVDRKIVEDNYRSRYGGRWLLQELTRDPAVPDTADSATSSGAHEGVLAARAWLDSSSYFAYQRQGLHLELEIAPGWHVYGPETPAGYTGLHIQAQSAPEGVRSGAPRWPETSPFRVEGLDEQFAVYQETVHIPVPIDFIINRGSGVVRLDVAIDLQACSETQCLPPTKLALTLTVPEAPVP